MEYDKVIADCCVCNEHKEVYELLKKGTTIQVVFICKECIDFIKDYKGGYV